MSYICFSFSFLLFKWVLLVFIVQIMKKKMIFARKTHKFLKMTYKKCHRQAFPLIFLNYSYHVLQKIVFFNCFSVLW